MSENNHHPALPKLRAIELRPQMHDGEAYVLLRDPLELSEQSLLLPQTIAPLLAFFDGHRTFDQAIADFRAQFGVRLEPGLLAQLVQALDECYLLENHRSQVATDALTDTFRRASTRPMTIVGNGYPATPHELQTFLDAYMPETGSAPLTHATDIAATNIKAQDTVAADAVGLLSPHIDYARGGPIYGQVWGQAAAAARQADVVIIFATDHYGYDPFTLTRQQYATPYGILPTDAPLNDALVAALGEDKAFAGELRHRREHSIELVAVWLHHARAGIPCPVLPILCGSLFDHILNGDSPAAHPQVAAVLDVLCEQMQSRRVLVVASGDLAHVGPAFRGKPLNESARAALRAADEELLAQMARGDAEGFFQAISAVQDRNNVCGVMPIYLTMKLLERVHGSIAGQVTGYAACPADTDNTSAVTIAGVVFG